MLLSSPIQGTSVVKEISLSGTKLCLTVGFGLNVLKRAKWVSMFLHGSGALRGHRLAPVMSRRGGDLERGKAR